MSDDQNQAQPDWLGSALAKIGDLPTRLNQAAIDEGAAYRGRVASEQPQVPETPSFGYGMVEPITQLSPQPQPPYDYYGANLESGRNLSRQSFVDSYERQRAAEPRVAPLNAIASALAGRPVSPYNANPSNYRQLSPSEEAERQRATQSEYASLAAGIATPELASATGLARFAPGPNQVQMFLAAEPRQAAAAEALERQGVHRDDIWRQTKAFRDTDGEWKREISDAPSRINPEAEEWMMKSGEGAQGLAPDVYEHPEAYEQLPGLRRHLVAMRPADEYRGGYTPADTINPAYIEARGRTPEEIRWVMAHEMQHAADELAGLPAGSSPEIHYERLKGANPHSVAALSRDLANKGYENIPNFANYSDWDQYLRDLSKTLYRIDNSEVRARAAAERLNMTEEQRAGTHPFESMDVPPEQQIIRKRQPGGMQQAASEAAAVPIKYRDRSPEAQEGINSIVEKYNKLGMEQRNQSQQQYFDDLNKHVYGGTLEPRDITNVAMASIEGKTRSPVEKALWDAWRERDMENARKRIAQRDQEIEAYLRPRASASVPVTQPAPRSIDPLGYYSQALEAAKSLPQAKGTPEQMLAQLKKAGVKDAEIQATNLPQFLEGKKSVTREEIARHLEDNRAGLSQKVYSRQDPEELYSKRNELNSKAIALGAQAQQARASGKLMEVERLLREQEAVRQERDLLPDRPRDDTHWADYSLDPRNPTYRETVLHLPRIPASDELKQKIAREEFGMDFHDMPSQMRGVVLGRVSTEMEPHNFQSGHFGEPNITGHLMTSMVKDKNGRNVFNVDQIQSDWGQKLREGGVRDEAKIADIQRQYDANDKKSQEAVRAAFSYVSAKTKGRNWTQTIREVADTGDKEAQRLLDDYLRTDREAKRLAAELSTAQHAASGHPLVNTTDQWVNTTLRAAIKQAAESGADAISIPSGDTVLSYNPGDTHGMNEFYGKIVPKNLKQLLKKLDPQSPPPEAHDTLVTPTKGERGKGFTVFPLTDKIKQSVLKEGQPLFKRGGAVHRDDGGPVLPGPGGLETRVVPSQAHGGSVTMDNSMTKGPEKSHQASSVNPEQNAFNTEHLPEHERAHIENPQAAHSKAAWMLPYLRAGAESVKRGGDFFGGDEQYERELAALQHFYHGPKQAPVAEEAPTAKEGGFKHGGSVNKKVVSIRDTFTRRLEGKERKLSSMEKAHARKSNPMLSKRIDLEKKEVERMKQHIEKIKSHIS